ncbi:hypothetical protein D8S78_13460 [Natrialba swarupiae]|nr:hypothetical protein [Natrialba swarupiae]
MPKHYWSALESIVEEIAEANAGIDSTTDVTDDRTSSAQRVATSRGRVTLARESVPDRRRHGAHVPAAEPILPQRTNSFPQPTIDCFRVSVSDICKMVALTTRVQGRLLM